MSLRSADELAEGACLQADICIVGAGAAGIALALELESEGCRVILLESGDVTPLDAADELDELEIEGHPLNVAVPVRRRCLGGTTVETYGRSVALDAIDFEDRPWVGGTSWPLSEEEISRWYGAAARILGLPRPDLLFERNWLQHPVVQAGRANDLAVRIHRWGKYIDLGQAWRRRLKRSNSIQVLLRGTAVDCQARAGETRIQRLACRALGGGSFSIEARVFVLACGGFENARLLLLSRHGKSPPPIDWKAVGRCYMNHPRSEGVAVVDLEDGGQRSSRWLRQLVMHRNRRARGRLQFSFSVSEELQRREELLNATSFFFAVSDARARAVRDAVRALRASWAEQGIGALPQGTFLLPHAPTLAAGAWHRLLDRPYRPVKLVAVDQCEQPVDAESRIGLGQARDRFGCPRLSLDWRIDPATTASLRRLHELLGGLLGGLGVGRFSSRLLDEPGYEPEFTDCAHPTGATRMSAGERDGVVDTKCRVHGLSNLFVVGSSVFPVGGHANPTLAIMALAVRLAAQLRGTWQTFSR